MISFRSPRGGYRVYSRMTMLRGACQSFGIKWADGWNSVPKTKQPRFSMWCARRRVSA